jgi:Recombination endonuclease VII
MPYKDREKRNANKREVRRRWYSHSRKTGGVRIKATRPSPEACEVCGNPSASGRRLDFDHCHTREVFRGWLCNPCNMTLGCAKDSPDRLRKLAAYLEDFELAQ